MIGYANRGSLLTLYYFPVEAYYKVRYSPIKFHNIDLVPTDLYLVDNSKHVFREIESHTLQIFLGQWPLERPIMFLICFHFVVLFLV